LFDKLRVSKEQWINSEKIPLMDLSKNELIAIAPYLHAVDCSDLKLDDLSDFFQSCSNAYHLIVSDNKITELKNLPPQLQTIDCYNCLKLKTIDLSNSPQLRTLNCKNCHNLESLDFSNTPLLEEVTCGSCNKLEPLNLSKNLQLKKFWYFCCDKLKDLDLSNNKLLEILDCRDCPISSLDLSNNKQLQILNCGTCENLKKLNLSNNKLLQTLDCSGCPIEALDLSENLQLQTLGCSNCPIKFLNLSNNLLLKELICNFCLISTLDLSKNLQLQTLSCAFCNNLKNLDPSKNTLLQTLGCGNCPIETLNLSNNNQLQRLDCHHCPIEALNLSHNTQLQLLDCNNCPIQTLDLSNNLQLKTLACPNCAYLTSLNLSHNLQLQTLNCNYCPFETLDLSNNAQLQHVICNCCNNLTSLGPSLSNIFGGLHCENCPRLAQLPQMPPTARVYSGNSPCGDLYSFKVNPAELEKNPKQVLLALGRILLQNRPFPNIVYLNSPGIDAGGLRRQLVSTLCEKLLKKDEDGYDIPILDDVDALRTFARLLGLGIPTGTNLHPSFFHALFALSDEELALPLTEPLQQKLYRTRHGLTDCEKQEVAEEANLLAAIALIAKELHALLGPRFRQFGIPEFMIYAQGSKVTKENLKENVTCENRQYKEWIDSFIDELPHEELKRFVMLLTGSYTLSGDKITFEVYRERKHNESSSVIHTCSKSMDLPGDLNEKELKKELKEQLKLIKSFNAS
jgi:hypothetical protein